MSRNVGEVLEFIPYERLGPVRFGMTRAEVKKQMGAPEMVEEDDVMERIHERRGPIDFYYDWDARKLTQLTVRQGVNVTLHDTDLFGGRDVVTFLESLDASGSEGGGYRNFPKLGLLLGGFGRKRIPEGKLLIVYDPSMKQEMANMTEV